MGESPSRASLEMSLLLFTLISTALAGPALHCPPIPPTDCGDPGLWLTCPGQLDHMGCPTPDVCIVGNLRCPPVCPHVEHPHCGFLMSNCPGPVDANGCETPMSCVMVDWAAGEQCPPPEEVVAASCPPWSPTDCGEGSITCPGEFDPRGCPMPDRCRAGNLPCFHVCPHVKHPHCGFAGLSYCASPVDEFGCETPMSCVKVDWAAGEWCPPPEEAAAASCPPWIPTDCFAVSGDRGQRSCVGVPSGYDARGCPMDDICVAEGGECAIIG